MGFVTLGIFSFQAIAIKGSILQMINHGIVTGALFMCVGIIYDRTKSREISYYGGLASTMPFYAALFMIFTLASIGLPGTNGFVGEFMILLGSFLRSKVIVFFAALGVIIGAAYMLWLYQRVFFQSVSESVKGLPGLKFNEIAAVLPMVFFVFLIGLYPKVVLVFMESSIKSLLIYLR
jgi:NADH-quinone oxidoreductase subunit M